MNIIIGEYRADDVSEMNRIWNEVVEDGVAFPQEEYMDFIFSILIILADVDISVMPVMQSSHRISMPDIYLIGLALSSWA